MDHERDNVEARVRHVLRRRRVRRGDCLRHALIAVDLPEDLAATCRVCQGSAAGVGPHCWLEFPGLAVDLIRPERTIAVEDYHRWCGFDPATVRRYTVREAAGLILERGLTFW